MKSTALIQDKRYFIFMVVRKKLRPQNFTCSWTSLQRRPALRTVAILCSENLKKIPKQRPYILKQIFV